MGPSDDGVRGLQIERYVLGPVIGTGSFATVYQAMDPRLNASVAVKVLADNWQNDPGVRVRFGQEAALLRRITAQHRAAPLVQVFDIDESGEGRPYFVMTFADRGTLSARMKQGHPWSPAQIAPVVDTLTNAMSALHAGGVVHRDLKPSNMLFVSSAGSINNEQMLIGDLGLAKDLLASGSALTLAGGTPGYMAPEQAAGTTGVTTAADIFSASVIITELLTGVRGLDGLDRLPPEAAVELERGMAMRPSNRHGSAPEWQAAMLSSLDVMARQPNPGADTVVRTVGGGHQPAGTEAGVESKRRLAGRPGRLAALGGVLVAAVVGLVMFGRTFLGGPPTVAIGGPTMATVGQSVLLTAEVPDDGTHFWIFEEERIAAEDLRLTPESVGSLEVRLSYRSDDGRTGEAVHLIQVGP